MPSTKQLEAKIKELEGLKAQLEQKAQLDYVSASGEEILNNLQQNSVDRENVKHLDSVLGELQKQCEEVRQAEEAKRLARLAKNNFNSLKKQAEVVQNAIAQLEEEIAKLKEIGRTIASEHKKTTNKIPLEDRLPRDYTLPTVEILNTFIILHNQPRKLS